MTLLCTALCAVALALTPAMAAETMTLNVTGSGPDGSPYSGTVTLTELEPGGPVETQAFKVVWKIGADTTEGLAIVNKDDRNVLSISYAYGNALGVATMRQDSDTLATGVWWVQGMPGIGQESWTKP